MKSQQQAEREEQQRIKNLVLGYDLREENEQSHDGDSHGFPTATTLVLEKNPNTKGLRLGPERSHYARPGSSRSHAPRARKLQLSDVDWYDESNRKVRSGPGDQNGDENRTLHSSPRFIKHDIPPQF